MLTETLDRSANNSPIEIIRQHNLDLTGTLLIFLQRVHDFTVSSTIRMKSGLSLILNSVTEFRKGHRALIVLFSLLFVGCNPLIEPVPIPFNPGIGDTLRVIWRVPKPFSKSLIDATSNLTPYRLDDSTLIMGFGDGFVCVNKNTGGFRWNTPLHLYDGIHSKSWGAGDMVVENERLYTVAGSDAIRGSHACAVCISTIDGHLIWRYDLAQNDYFNPGWSKYSHSPTAIFVNTAATHRVIALSKSDGSVLWDSVNADLVASANQSGFTEPLLMSQPSYRNGIIYFGCRMTNNVINPWNGVLDAMDALTGKLLWRKVIPPPDSTIGYTYWKQLDITPIAAAAVPTERGVIIAPGGYIALIDSTGKILWRKAPFVRYLTDYRWRPTLHDGLLYGYNDGGGDAFSFAMDPETGSVLWAKPLYTELLPTEETYTPVIDGGFTYDITDADWLICQSLTTGERAWGSDLGYYYGNDSPLGGFWVEGRRIYFETHFEIICLEHKAP
jgi:outer membrane protein assembly factor BamB